MTISIASRAKAERLLEAGFPKDTAVISFHDPDTAPLDYRGAATALLYVSFGDAQMQLSQADEIAAFVCAAVSHGWDILCQCESGLSRSAGLAAAISEHYLHDGGVLFLMTRYTPDETVYYAVLDALERV